jgi:hypothetical protein
MARRREKVPIVDRRSERSDFELQFTTKNSFVRGHGRLAGQFGKSILEAQSLTDLEWLYSNIWAIAKDSSNVMSIRYVYASMELWVLFASRHGRRRIYVYYAVPAVTAQQFFLAPSLGQFVHFHLIGAFVARQINY